MASRSFLIAVAALAVVSPRAVAQGQPAAPTSTEKKPSMDMAARRQSVVTLQRHIGQREERLKELGESIRRVDARIERRIDELVKMLVEVKDSQNSRTRIAQTKSNAIKQLRGMVQVYLTRRADLFDALQRRPDKLPVAEINKDIEAFDKRIEKRIQQILELSKSMDQYRDVRKYERDGGTYWDGWYEETSRVSEDWKQNRRQKAMTNKQRAELIKALKGGIERLEQRRASIQDILDNRKPSKAERNVQLEELGRVDAAIERSQRQIDSLVQPSGDEPRETVDRNQAMEIGNMISDSSEDLARDFDRLLRMVSEYIKDQVKVYQLTENLKARQEWLKEHDTEKDGK